jgi:phosphoglycerol transferase MdoB-like AlkP superfamily enzyme
VIVSFLMALILTLYRMWLCYERGSELGELTLLERLRLFWIGFRLDAVIVCRTTIVLILILIFLPASTAKTFNGIFLVCAAVVFFVLFFAETAGVYFFRYYDFRPNYLVLEYGSGQEVLRTITKVYPIARIVAGSGLLTMVVLVILHQAVNSLVGIEGQTPYWFWDRGGTFCWLLLTGFATRGTLSHRPLNPSFAMVTQNRIANEIAGCGIFNVLYEWGNKLKKEFTDLKTVIKPLPLDEALLRSQAVLSKQGQLTSDSQNPLVRRIDSGKSSQSLNVVLVVMESFTSKLVGAVGGSPALTPEFDRLAAQGILLEQCYATGERTIQGLEAILSSFPPLPGAGVVKRPQARQNFATLASLLKERGYATQFLYGGQGIFDHMRAFFLGNGFDAFIEEKDFENPLFRGAWGVSDEDVFRRADQEFRTLTSQGRNFFATILTVSLHSPWKYPPNRIQPLPANTPVPAGFELEELNNFLYADYAVGQFMREVRNAPYFANTLFVFVGDHGIHLRGRDLIPVDEYRVPVLFYAPAHLSPQRHCAVTSQIDITPTIMGILGGEYRSPFFGRDVLNCADDKNFAMMIYNKKRYGIVSGSHVVVLTETGETLACERNAVKASWLPVAKTPKQQEICRNATALLGAAQELLIRGHYTAEVRADNVVQSA